MIQIYVDSHEVYAKLNFARDKALGLLNESWEEVKEEYIEEAMADPDIVLTMEELNSILRGVK